MLSSNIKSNEMNDKDEIKINVVIAERNFRLTINKADEEKVIK